MCSTPGDVQYTGGLHEYMYSGGYHEYTRGVQYTGDIMSTVGVGVWVFSTPEGYHEYTEA